MGRRVGSGTASATPPGNEKSTLWLKRVPKWWIVARGDRRHLGEPRGKHVVESKENGRNQRQRHAKKSKNVA